MNDIRVLVVDDSAFMRKMITDMIQTSKGMSVVDTARNGQQALDKIRSLKPDVVTLDVEMPVLDGLSVLREIMNTEPIPVIMLSSLTQHGADATIKSMELGAVDFVSKPSGSISLDIDNVKEELINKIHMAYQANLQKKPAHYQVKNTKQFLYHRNLIAIGVSTGGPKALQILLNQLPQELASPVIVIQHMPASFTKSLARRLNQLSSLTVKEADHGEILKQGTVYIAPGGKQLTVKKVGQTLVINIDLSPTGIKHTPSVDYTYHSLSKLSDFNLINVILTGMGSDGTNGLKQIKQSQPSHYIIAESEETSVIYGMPKSAIENVGADAVLPINKIGEALTELVVQKGES
ncbi:protein-glutamate methylesterase/protein-glutamine glutaminase [Piscibacillus salipiscarius]|uniref:Protein-glutamate methylesterase/protein-glutamine glutaminase n=1 Tax=Piscibacillus salipiscarius TaxID=299480 RepID=A0ABW5Q8R6_9BACI